MEDNTSKVFIAGDANLAGAALLNASSHGTSLFLINLCASQAPLVNVGKSLPGLEPYRLYQVARREDGRTRYRLRLGFFTSEADAEAVLNTVRDSYPTAFTACLCDEDRKFTRGFVPESAVPAPAPKLVPAAPKIAVVENKPVAKKEPAKSATATATAIVKPSPAKAPTTDTVTVKTLTSAASSSTTPNKVAAPSPSLDSTAKHKRIAEPVAKATPKSAPAPVAAAPASAPVEIELSWEPPALQPPANAAPTQVVAPAFKTQEVIKAPAAPASTKTPAKAAPQVAKAAEPKPAPKDTIAAPSKFLSDIELTLESESNAAPKAAPPKGTAATSSNEPFRVGKGIEIPKSALSLELEQTASTPMAPVAAKPAPVPPAPRAAQPVAAKAPTPPPVSDIARMKAAQATAPAAMKAASVAPPIRKVDGPPPDLDSTQTIRALTSDELKDESQEKWFAIQLAVSDQPVNLDTMPRLDIFEAYRLYSVASAGSGKITHSLRIGFFREDHSAEAVSGYLKTFFNSPTVVRISIAEQARFKDAPTPKPAAAKADAKVLDLSHARDRAPKVVPTVTMEVETKKFDPGATGSFKANSTGMHKALTSGSDALNATGTHKALGATGTHKSLKAASKSATPPTKRSQPLSSATGRHKALDQKKSLSQQLMDEARQVELSQSGIRKLPKNDSLLSKMFGKKK